MSSRLLSIDEQATRSRPDYLLTVDLGGGRIAPIIGCDMTDVLLLWRVLTACPRRFRESSFRLKARCFTGSAARNGISVGRFTRMN